MIIVVVGVAYVRCLIVVGYGLVLGVLLRVIVIVVVKDGITGVCCSAWIAHAACVVRIKSGCW